MESTGSRPVGEEHKSTPLAATADADRMHDAQLNRRNLLRLAGFGLVGSAGAVQSGTVAADEDDDPTAITDWHDLDAVRDSPGGEYVLMNDLDEDTDGYEEHVADPEGGWEPVGPFTGEFGGNGYGIAGLQIDRPDRNRVGLFSEVEGTVNELTLTDAEITGDDKVGCLTGRNFGEIVDSTASGAVTGNRNVGVLVGFHAGQLLNSHYSIEDVSVNGDTKLTAGGLFPEQYADWEANDRELSLAAYDSLAVSDGTVLISSVQGIRDALGFIDDSDLVWELTADLDLTGDSVGLYLPYVAGEFDGNGYTLTVDLDMPTVSQVGAIGYNTGTISSLSASGSVTGNLSVGSLVGGNDGTVSASAASGTVTGDQGVGGLVGRNKERVSTSKASVEVTGVSQVGGLVGLNNGDLSESTASGTVTGGSEVGGLAGENFETVVSSSASSAVTGDGDVGGLVGRNFAEVASSFAVGEVSGDSAGGFVGSQQLDGTVTAGYWDTDSTGRDEGISSGSGDVTALSTSEMQGEAAEINMQALDFEETWQTVDDGYPIFQWQGPTEISDWHDLDAVREVSNGEFVLVTDLDENTAGYDEHIDEPAEGWSPIGRSNSSAAPPFTGRFDGNGHEIAGLQIDRPEREYVGLFGAVDTATITNVTLAGVDIVGKSAVGGGIGQAEESEISAMTVSGDVTGSSEVGGLVGRSNEGALSELVANVSVTGDTQVGGLVGVLSGELSDSTATGAVTGEELVGGLVGSPGGEISNSYYSIEDVLINGEETLTIGGLFSDQYQDWQANGKELSLTAYDSLTVVDGTVEISDSQGVRDALGFIDDPDLQWELTADLDLTGDAAGLYLPYFAGELDGNDHTLTLDVNVPAVGYIGAIGYNTGAVTAVSVDGTVTGDSVVGGLVGRSTGDVSESTATVETTADSVVGGLVGASTGEISQSIASGTVSGGIDTGGLVGSNSGEVREVTASGDVTGDSGVGGLAGVNDGTIRNSESTSAVEAGRYTGGAVGFNSDDATVHGVDATGSVTGERTVGGLVGGNIKALVVGSTAAGDVTGTREVGGLVGTNDIDSTIRESSATGDVEGESTLGGLVGWNNDARIVASHARGIVRPLNDGLFLAEATAVGGLVGYNDRSAVIEQSYSEGWARGFDDVGGLVGVNSESSFDNDVGATVSGSYTRAIVDKEGDEGTAGGLVGRSADNSEVSASYWNSEATGQDSSAGGTELAAAEMTGDAAVEHMSGLDFDVRWHVVTDPDGYPTLQWQESGKDDDPEDSKASYSVSNLDPAVAEIESGEVLTVTATISNSGDEDGAKDVEFRLDGDSLVTEENFPVGADDTEQVSFTAEAPDVGTYTYSVVVPEDDDESTGELTVVEPPAPAAFELSNLDPVTATVSPGVELTISAAVENVGAESGSATVQFTLDGESLDSKDVTIDGGDTATVSFDVDSPAADGEYEHGIAVGDDTLTGTLTVEAEDDGGTGGPPPIVGDRAPEDINGDGLYEDVNGDGNFDIFDIQALFNNLDNEDLQNNSEFFNFAGDDPAEVTIFDVQALFNQL